MSFTLVNSAAGELDLAEAFQWDHAQIMAFLQAIDADPAAHGVKKQIVGDGETPFFDSLTEVVDNIGKLYAIDAPIDVRLHDDYSTVDAPFDGAHLPAETIYDYLAWILSISATPPSGEVPTESNFYLPLLAVFSKWCRTIIPENLAPATTHIAYWEDLRTKKPRVLLGATIGSGVPIAGAVEASFAEDDENKFTPRSYIAIANRQNLLDNLGYNPGEDFKRDGKEPNIGYGRCAETAFFIWAATYAEKHKDLVGWPEVRGFAIQPTKRLKPGNVPSQAFAQGSSYDHEDVLATLLDPCKESCQGILLKQMGELWSWEPEFMIADIPRLTEDEHNLEDSTED